jgi:hypothetical protein
MFLAGDWDFRFQTARTAAHISGAVIALPIIALRLNFRHITLDPPQDGRVDQGDAPFGHHLDQITGTQLEAQVPPHAQDDDLLVEMPAFEKFWR